MAYPGSMSLWYPPRSVVGTSCAPELIYKVLLHPCQGPGPSGLRGDEMCEVRAGPRGVQWPPSQEKRALTAPGVGGFGALGNSVREDFLEVGDSGRWADKMGHVTGLGGGCWQNPGGHFAESLSSCVGRAEALLLVLARRDPVQAHQCIPVCWPHPGHLVPAVGQAPKAHGRHLKEQKN